MQQQQSSDSHYVRGSQSYHKLGQSIVSADLRGQGYTWLGEVWMGKETQLDVVFDTGSDWLVIESQSCKSCEGDRYDISP